MNGSTIVNFPTGYTILRTDYDGSTANDLYSRFQIEESVLPCIYYGLEVTVNAGLVVNVSVGNARGLNIQFTQTVGSATLPTKVGLASTQTVTCTDNATGYIVLNVQITPGPTVNADTYSVITDNGAGSPLPVYVSSLTPGVGVAYPYTQIVLAQVITSGGAITSIVTTGSNRSFDFSSFFSEGSGATGDVKQSYNPVQSAEWIQMNDGSIGSAASGATTLASAQASALYTLLWNQIPDTWCPVAGGRGASAAADFSANKAMFLPATVGRALCNSGTAVLNQTFTADSGTDLLTVATTSSLYSGTPVTVSNSGGALPAPLAAATTYYVINVSGTTIQLAATAADVNTGTQIDLTTNGTGTQTITVDYAAYVSGQIAGEQAHQILTTELAAHTHTYGQQVVLEGNGSTITSAGLPTAGPTGSTGGNIAHNNIQPSTFIPVWIHL